MANEKEVVQGAIEGATIALSILKPLMRAHQRVDMAGKVLGNLILSAGFPSPTPEREKALVRQAVSLTDALLASLDYECPPGQHSFTDCNERFVKSRRKGK